MSTLKNKVQLIGNVGNEPEITMDLQQKTVQLIARFKQLHFDYTFLFQIH